MQYFSSFAARVGQSSTPSDSGLLQRYLPRVDNASVYADQKSTLVISRATDDRLHKTIFVGDETFYILLQGVFYAPIQQSMLQSCVRNRDRTSLIALLNHLDGSFSGFTWDAASETAILFVDWFGFEQVFYAFTESSLWFSNYIWSVLRAPKLKPSVNRHAIEEICVFGYPIADRMPLSEVSTVPPGKMVIVQRGKKETFTYMEQPKRDIVDAQSALHIFTDAIHQHFSNLESIVSCDKWATTLTGGKDTRVILSALLHEGVMPHVYMGSSGPLSREIRRAKAVAELVDVPYHIVDLMNKPGLDFDATVLSNSSSTGSGLWMATLASAALQTSELICYGFSGDFMSGKSAVKNVSEMTNLDELSNRTFDANRIIEQDFDKFISDVLHANEDDLRARYRDTFNELENYHLVDRLILQRLRTRNFRRIGAFASGAKLGANGVYFFHSLPIACFYYRLSPNLLVHQNIHSKLGYLGHRQLWRIPANQWFIPQRFEARWEAPITELGHRARTLIGISGKPNPPKNPNYVLLRQADIIDVDAFARHAPTSPNGQSMLSALRRASRVVLFARGVMLDEIEQTNLFPAQLQAQVLQPLSMAE